jgi:CRISPR/Cas system-associated exonuclease Cas4 (RecB family)
MALLRDSPYIWVTWLTKLLAGENSCEWAAWFRSQHEGWSWEKVPGTFDLVGWQLKHTARLNESREHWEELGYTVFTENQNRFTLRGKTASLGGKPDLITRRGGCGTIIDVKTGKPSPSHSVQVMLYMYAVPRALGQYNGVIFNGQVAYSDHVVDIPAAAVDEQFIGNLLRLIHRLGSGGPARKVPSRMECRYCDITAADCPQRVADDRVEEGATEDF